MDVFFVLGIRTTNIRLRRKEASVDTLCVLRTNSPRATKPITKSCSFYITTLVLYSMCHLLPLTCEKSKFNRCISLPTLQTAAAAMAAALVFLSHHPARLHFQRWMILPLCNTRVPLQLPLFRLLTVVADALHQAPSTKRLTLNIYTLLIHVTGTKFNSISKVTTNITNCQTSTSIKRNTICFILWTIFSLIFLNVLQRTTLPCSHHVVIPTHGLSTILHIAALNIH